MVIVNEKFRERVPAWTTFQMKPEHFPGFFNLVLEWAAAPNSDKISLTEQTRIIIFLDHCFTSMEVSNEFIAGNQLFSWS